jgi:hypothetical protein
LNPQLIPDGAVKGLLDREPPLWRVVVVHIGGFWVPGVLSAGRRLPPGLAGHVRWRPGLYGEVCLYAPWCLCPAVLLQPGPTPAAPGHRPALDRPAGWA